MQANTARTGATLLHNIAVRDNKALSYFVTLNTYWPPVFRKLQAGMATVRFWPVSALRQTWQTDAERSFNDRTEVRPVRRRTRMTGTLLTLSTMRLCSVLWAQPANGDSVDVAQIQFQGTPNA